MKIEKCKVRSPDAFKFKVHGQGLMQIDRIQFKLIRTGRFLPITDVGTMHNHPHFMSCNTYLKGFTIFSSYTMKASRQKDPWPRSYTHFDIFKASTKPLSHHCGIQCPQSFIRASRNIPLASAFDKSFISNINSASLNPLSYQKRSAGMKR